MTIYGFAGRADEADIEQFIADTGVGGFDHLIDVDGAGWARYDVTTQPAFVFIDDDGTVDTHLGALGAEALEDRLADLVES